MMHLHFVPRLAGVLALTAALFPGASRAESRPPLDQAVKRCVLIVRCKVEIKDNLINYRVVESWKGKYSPDLFYTEPLEGYLFRVGEEIGASRTSNLKDGQEVVFFYSDNAVSAVKKGKILSHAYDDIFVVAHGKVVYELNSLPESPEDRQTYTVEQFKKSIQTVVEGDLKQSAKQEAKAEFLKQLKDVPQELAAIPLPAKTPFDADELKKAGYLHAYRRGYEWTQGIHIRCPTNPSDDNLHAIRGWVEGWQAGVKAGGQGDLPAKYAPYLIWRVDGAGRLPPVEWNPALIEGGFMFKDMDAFRQYLLEADSVAIGRLTNWDGSKGQVRVEQIYRGTPGDNPSFAFTGGLVKPTQGDKVLVVLSKRDGEVVLHSFCAASGLFAVKDGLEALVEKQLGPKQVREPGLATAGFDPAGRWRLTMPAGFEYDATLEPLREAGQYRLHCGAATLRGVYSLQGRRLTMKAPEDERLVGLVWQIKNVNTLLLTDHPAQSQFGSDYTNATLCRKPPESKDGVRSDWPPRTTVEELDAMCKAGNYHLIREQKIGHQIESTGTIESVGKSDGPRWLLLKLPGDWWQAHLLTVSNDDRVKPGDRVRFRAMIVDESYSALWLWAYSWSKEASDALQHETDEK